MQRMFGTMLVVMVLGLHVVHGLLSPARIPIYMQQYVKLHVGNPGRTILLRLRFDLDTSYLYDTPETYSDTFRRDPAESSDIFYLNNIKLRLPVVYSGGAGTEPEPRLDTTDGVDHGGSLALGVGSTLWKHWRSATVSRYTLTLGRFDDLDVRTLGPEAPMVEFLPNRASPLLGDPVLQVCGLTGLIPLHSELGSTPPFSTNTTSPLVDEHYLLPVEVRLYEEFTYIPSLLKTSLAKLLHRMFHLQLLVRNDTLPQCPNDDVLTTVVQTDHLAHRHSMEICVSLDENLILTPLSNKESIIRKSETNLQHPLPSGAVSLGRITAMQEMVVYVDQTSGLTAVSPLYSAYPKFGEVPPAVLQLLGITMWLWWVFTTHPMLYLWTKELLFRGRVTRPRAQQQQRQQRQPPPRNATTERIGDELSDRSILLSQFNRLGTVDRRALLTSAAATTTTNQTAQQGSGVRDDGSSQLQGMGVQIDQLHALASICPNEQDDDSQQQGSSFYERKLLERYTPVDMDTLNVLLHVVRVTVFWTLYSSVWGFDSVRFAERLARQAHYSSAVGSVMFYGVLVVITSLTGMCSSRFVERFPVMSFYSIEVVLLLVTWLNLLPDMGGMDLDVSCGFLISAFLLARLMQWVFWVAVRGPDWTAPVFYRFHQQYLPNFTAIPMAGPAGGLQGLVFRVWLTVLLPLAIAFFYCLGAAPLIELIWPGTPVRWALALLLIVCGAMFLAFSSVMKSHMQILYEVALRTTRRWQQAKQQL